MAFFLTWIIIWASKAFKVVVRFPVIYRFAEKDLSNVLQKCHALFPVETILFKGKTFERGMKIRITTIQKKTIEGQLVGRNDDNMLCLLTSRNLIAQQIDGIAEIILLET